MEMDANNFREVESRFNSGFTRDEIRDQLAKLGFSDETLDELMQYYRSLKFQRQRKNGFKLLMAGAVLCLSSCILTFFHNYSEGYTIFTLYGITIFGACCLLVGLALVLGL